MEPPTKRPRLSIAPDPYPTPGPEPNDENTDDQDNVDLQTARARNDQRLKSIFESIFEKYGRDFTDVGDEIDLQTGKIVVDNGHLGGMEGEDDTGDADGGQGDEHEREQGDDDDDGESETETGTEGGDDYGMWSFSGSQTGIRDHRDNNAWEWQGDVDDADGDDNSDDNGDDDDDDRSSVDSLLDTALSVNDPGTIPPSKEPPTLHRSNEHNGMREPVESIWRVPDISPKFSFSTPQPRPTHSIHSNNKPAINYNSTRSVSPPGRSLWAIPHPGRPRKTNTDIPKEKKAKKDVDAKKNTKKTTAPYTAKPKQCSSPVRKGDWSIANYNGGSESESDDPLQEDYQPSPTLKNALNIRGKGIGSITPSRKQSKADSKAQSTPKPIGSAKKHSNIPLDNPRYSSSSPTKTKRAMTPDEVKLIVTMRYVQKTQWKHILAHFPGRRLDHLRDWNRLHWSERRVNSPRLSSPWSSEDRDKLSMLKDKTGLSWPDIRKEFPGRSHAEIEFELLRLWVGDEVWNHGGLEESRQDRLGDVLDDSHASQYEDGGSAGARDIGSAASADQKEPTQESVRAHSMNGEHDSPEQQGQDDAAKRTANAHETVNNGRDASQPEPYQGSTAESQKSQPQSSPQKTLSTLF